MAYDTAPRRMRHRPAKSPGHALDQALFREALRRWLEWLMVHGVLERRHVSGAEAPALGTTYESMMRAIGSRGDRHADPVVAALLAQERQRWDWPASIHAIVLDMPRDWRLCLLGTALEYSQAGIGQALGLRQQLVGVMLARAREQLLMRLRVLVRTRRELRELGLGG